MLLKYKLLYTQYLKRSNNKPNRLFEIFELFNLNIIYFISISYSVNKVISGRDRETGKLNYLY